MATSNTLVYRMRSAELKARANRGPSNGHCTKLLNKMAGRTGLTCKLTQDDRMRG